MKTTVSIGKLRKENNCLDITCELFYVNKKIISGNTLAEKFRIHPYNGTLLSIGDVLGSLNIKTKTIKIPLSKLELMTKPCLVEIADQDHNSFIAIIKDITPLELSFYDPLLRKWLNLKISIFQERWTGICMLADFSGYVRENNDKITAFKNQLVRIFKLFVPILILFSTATTIELGPGINGIKAWVTIAFFLSFFFGTLVTSFLLSSDLNEGASILLRKICTRGEDRDCSAILNSAESKIGGISWSAVGFVYFSGGLFSCLVWGLNNLPLLNVLSIINLMGLPFVAYSIYMQFWVIRRWCLFCLVVLFLLSLQSSYFFINYERIDYNLFFKTSINLLLIYATTILLLNLVIMLVEREVQGNNDFVNLTRLKFNGQVFNTLLLQEKRIITNPDIGIILGSDSPKIHIVKICNPYCTPCSSSHFVLEQLMAQNADIQVQIIYNIPNVIGDLSSELIKLFVKTARTENQSSLKTLLHRWYGGNTKSYAEFEGGQTLEHNLDIYSTELDKMVKWCDEMGEGDQSPIFFVNGYRLPQVYSVDDLRYLF